MVRNRRQYSAEYKFKVAVEATGATKTLGEIASETGVHPNQISQWKGRLLDEGASLFRRDRDPSQHEPEKVQAELYEQIGRLKMELEWLKTRAAGCG